MTEGRAAAVRQRRHFPHFDSVRGLAVLMVLTVHGAIYAGTKPGATMWPYIERLEVAVPIFLVISGFLLYRQYAAASLRGASAPALRVYVSHRVARIVPGYWMALTVTTLVLGLSEVFTPSGIPTFYGFGQIYSMKTMAHGIPQAWTLGVEVTFYLFLPLWALWMRRSAGAPVRELDREHALPAERVRRWLRRELMALGLLALASVAYKLVLMATGAVGPRIPALQVPITSLPGYLDQFAAGMALAVLSVAYEARGQLPRWLKPIDRLPGLSWALCAATFLWAAKLSGLSGHAPAGYTHLQYLERQLVNAVIAVTFVAPAIFGDQSRGLVRRLLSLRLVAYLGVVSYGLYLYHLFVLSKLVDFGWADVHFIHPYITWIGGVILFTLLPASLSWYLLERPSLRLADRLRRGRSPRQPGSAGGVVLSGR